MSLLRCPEEGCTVTQTMAGFCYLHGHKLVRAGTCPNGHTVRPEWQFCRDCGAMVVSTSSTIEEGESS